MNPHVPEILVVTYHFITGTAFPGQGGHPFGAERFQEQVERLARTSRFLSLEDLEGSTLPGLGDSLRYVLLTFDDGLAEQFEAAWPILKAKGIPAAFFPCTFPLQTGKLLHVHRLHALRGVMEDHELLELFGTTARNLGFEESLRAIRRGGLPEAPYPYDRPESRTLKSLFNYTLPQEEREALSEKAFQQVLGDESSWAAKVYMGPEMLVELGREGCLGTHTHAHRPLSCLDREGIRREIFQSLDVLEKTAGIRPGSLSYPYGNNLAVSTEVFEIARECGLKAGFTTFRRTNAPDTDRMQLGRFDAEDIPPGKRPILSL